MEPIEIITIIACVAIVGGVIGSYIYKKIKHKPTGCSGCGGGCSGCSGCSGKCYEIKPKEEKPQEETSKVDETKEDNKQ